MLVCGLISRLQLPWLALRPDVSEINIIVALAAAFRDILDLYKPVNLLYTRPLSLSVPDFEDFRLTGRFVDHSWVATNLLLRKLLFLLHELVLVPCWLEL